MIEGSSDRTEVIAEDTRRLVGHHIICPIGIGTCVIIFIAIQYFKDMIDNILKSSNPENPPIIIFQSDHGARNIKLESGNELLNDYPAEYQYNIVNTILLPNCPNAPLSQDMDSINTFPIVFNCYFDTDYPLK